MPLLGRRLLAWGLICASVACGPDPGDEPICDRDSLADKVAPGDKMFILQALSGG